MMSYKRLKQIAADTKISVVHLLALSPKNDPFYAGKPTDVLMAEWFRGVWDDAGYTSGVHLRRAHYWVVSQGNYRMHNGETYENTEACWKYLTQAAKMARYLGYVGIDQIQDNKNPEPQTTTFHNYRSNITFEVPVPNLDEPEVNLYGPGDANAQPYYMEIWCEKSTMNDILLPIAREYGATLVTFEGEASITACNKLVKRIQERGGKPTRVFYISDFDPAGNSMPVATSRKVEFILAEGDYPELDVKIRPLALNAEQIERYNLPRIPIKETEKRAGKFEAAFGAGACELDALEALYPGVLADMVRDALSPYYSEDARDYAHDQARALREAVERHMSEIMGRYQAEIDAVRGMFKEMSEIKLDARYVVLPFEADVEENPDEWLFDSKRDYADQLAFYKRHKGLLGDRDEE
jgi:hypothetical protein